MNKTLLNHFTVIQPENVMHDEMHNESLHELVCDMKHLLLQAEKDLLSPRPDAVKQLLQKALN